MSEEFLWEFGTSVVLRGKRTREIIRGKHAKADCVFVCVNNTTGCFES